MRPASWRIVAITLIVCVLASPLSATAGAAAPASATVTFTPVVLPLIDPEIASPERGAYRWYGDAPQPSGWPTLDSYRRYSWRELETAEGTYNWSLIDNELAAAASRGGRFGLRVMPANSFDGGTSIPDYLMARMPKGFTFAHPDTGRSTYAPDWNDADYMARAEALIRALATRYAINACN